MSPPQKLSDLDVSTVDNFIALAPPVNYGQKKAFAAIGAICLVIGGAAMAMRILTSRRSGEKTLARDWTFGVAMVLFVAFICASIAMFSFGDELNVMAYAGASVASTAFYTGTLVLLRIATLCLYQDMIFNQTRHWRFSIVLGIILTVYSFIFVIADALQCKPNTSHKDINRCINISDLEIVVGIFDFITLSVILTMPVKDLWQGRRSPNHKNNICYAIALSLGFIACILSLAHAVAPAGTVWTWSLMYPLTGLLTLTLIIIAFAIIDIPTFVRHRAGPIQSPTATHPHLQSFHSHSASVVSWVAEQVPPRNNGVKSKDQERGHARNNSADTSPSFTEDLEKSTEVLADVTGPERTSFIERVCYTERISNDEKLAAEPPKSDDRTNSMRSFTRLGSLTGAVKPPSFLQNRTSSLTGSAKPPSFLQNRTGSLTSSVKPPSFLAARTSRSRNEPPQELDLTGITVKTEVQMSWEARRKALSRGQSRSASPARGRKTEAPAER